MKLEMGQVQEIYQFVTQFVVESGFQLLAAIFIFIIGFLLAKRLSKFVFNLCQRKDIDITLSKFIASVARILIVAIITMIALEQMNVNVAPIIAIAGALSLGAGLAVQGLLSNYSAGLNIIFTRPFVVGDTISVQGVTGVVKEVFLANTLLIDEDNVEILIPNRHIVGEIIHNSHKETLLELEIGVAYNSDMSKVFNIIEAALTELALPESNRKPLIGIASFADSAIAVGVRLWVPTVQAHEKEFQANQLMFNVLIAAEVVIPFPQREVTLINS